MDLQDRSYGIPSWQEAHALSLAVLSILLIFVVKAGYNPSVWVALIWAASGVVFLFSLPKNKQTTVIIPCYVYALSWFVVSPTLFGILGFALGVILAFYIAQK